MNSIDYMDSSWGSFSSDLALNILFEVHGWPEAVSNTHALQKQILNWEWGEIIKNLFKNWKDIRRDILTEIVTQQAVVEHIW